MLAISAGLAVECSGSNNSGPKIFVIGIESGDGVSVAVAAVLSSVCANTATIIKTKPMNNVMAPMIFISLRFAGRSWKTSGLWHLVDAMVARRITRLGRIRKQQPGDARGLTVQDRGGAV